MIFDFSQKCKTYDADSYKKDGFSRARCPKCRAVGRFGLHGAYHRHVVYFSKFKLVHKLMKVKRVRCLSCKCTHAVMPGDMAPYRLLSLFAVVFMLNLFYLKKTPALKIAAAWGFSHQFVYSVLLAFRLHASRICQYFREASPSAVPPEPGLAVAAALVRSYSKYFLYLWRSLDMPP